jgi:hypothetical protein
MLNPNIHLSNTAPQVSPWAPCLSDLMSSESGKGTLSSSTHWLGLPAKGTIVDPLDGGTLTFQSDGHRSHALSLGFMEETGNERNEA